MSKSINAIALRMPDATFLNLLNKFNEDYEIYFDEAQASYLVFGLLSTFKVKDILKIVSIHVYRAGDDLYLDLMYSIEPSTDDYTIFSTKKFKDLTQISKCLLRFISDMKNGDVLINLDKTLTDEEIEKFLKAISSK